MQSSKQKIFPAETENLSQCYLSAALSAAQRMPDAAHLFQNDDFSLAVSDFQTEDITIRHESDGRVSDHTVEKYIESSGIFSDIRYLFFVYHFTGSLRMFPSVASSAVNVLPRYCTQSITRGSVPLLRTLRRPSGATRTTDPSSTGKTSPST